MGNERIYGNSLKKSRCFDRENNSKARYFDTKKQVDIMIEKSEDSRQTIISPVSCFAVMNWLSDN